MHKDNLFQSGMFSGPFEFNQDVANAFEDMLHRSVPFYSECLNQMAQLASDVHWVSSEGKIIYDLGCSLGGWVPYLKKNMPKINYIGLDASCYMIKKAKALASNTIQFIVSDITQLNQLEDAGVVACNLVLQFTPQSERARLIQMIYHSLPVGGRLLLVEKIHQASPLQESYRHWYHQFKSNNNYTHQEIQNKEKALRTVLVTNTQMDYEGMLEDAGFSVIDIFFKWYNFTGFVAQK